MPVDGPVPWRLAPHTAAKHRIYREYLDRWYPILLSEGGYRAVTYAEGFAGPGVYVGDEPGSPVLAIDAMRSMEGIESSPKPTRFLFIDDDERCVSRLAEELPRRFPNRPRNRDLMPVKIALGKCADIMETELERLQSWGQPILAVLDSWGNAPVPHRLLRRLADNPASEVIVTLLPEHFVRFVSTYGPAADDVFGGTTEWRKVADLPNGPPRRRFLLDNYRQMLQRTGFRYIVDFEMVDATGTELYLIFGTTHPRGLQKMKQAVWQVDPSFGVRFRDPRDEQDETLFLLEDPESAPLRRLLHAEMTRRDAPVRVEDLRKFALFQTVYREEHVIPALREMRDAGSLESASAGPIARSTMVRLTPGRHEPGR